MPKKATEFLLLDPNDITKIVGETTSIEIQKELHITPAQFQRYLSNNSPYKGCILVEKNINTESRHEQLFDRLILENNNGRRYYATSNCRIYVIYKNGKKKYLSLYKKTRHNNQLFVKLGLKEESAIRIFARLFLDMRPDQVCALDGKLCLKNIKVYNKNEFSAITGKMSKSIRVGLFEDNKNVCEWASARDAAKDLYISYQTVSDYCNHKVKNPMYDLRWLG